MELNMRSWQGCTNVSTAVHILRVPAFILLILTISKYNLLSKIIVNNYTSGITVITNPDQSVDDNSLQMFIVLKISGSQLCWASACLRAPKNNH